MAPAARPGPKHPEEKLAGRIAEPRYVSGMVAGKMTRSDKPGHVAAISIPEVVRRIN